MKQRTQKQTTRADDARAVANLALATAQPIAAYFSKWSGRGVSDSERSRRSSGPVTPAPGTFTIWGPLFVESLRYAAWSADREQRGEHALRRVSWLTSATFASTSAWSINAQLRGLGWASVGIISAGALSSTAALLEATRHAHQDEGARRAARSIAPLAGWLTLASFANLEATLNETAGRPIPRVEASRAMLLLGAATVTAGAVTLASNGNPLYTGAVAWGLGGTIVRNVREQPLVARVAGVGIAALAALTLVARKRSEAPRSQPPLKASGSRRAASTSRARSESSPRPRG